MLTCITFVSYFIFLSLFSLLILLLSLSFLPYTEPAKPNFFKTNLSKIVNWRVILYDHIRKKSSNGLIFRVETTLFMDIFIVCENPMTHITNTKNILSSVNSFPESNLAHNYLWIRYFTQMAMATNSDVWPSVVIGTFKIDGTK